MEGDTATGTSDSTTTDFNPHPPYGGWRRLEHGKKKPFKFQSTPSVWRVTPFCNVCEADEQFQSTPSVWRVTTSLSFVSSTGTISIHTLRMEGDENVGGWLAVSYRFQSTPSVWRVTVKAIMDVQKCDISIHTLRMEGDGFFFYFFIL